MINNIDEAIKTFVTLYPNSTAGEILSFQLGYVECLMDNSSKDDAFIELECSELGGEA